MDEPELNAVLEAYSGWFTASAAQLRGAQGGTVRWPDLATMLDAYVEDHPDQETATRVFYQLNDDNTVVDVSLKGDPFTVWRWLAPPSEGGPSRPSSAGALPRASRTEPSNDWLVTAAELRLVNSPQWPDGPRRRGKTYLQRRFGWTADQARERLRSAQHLAEVDPAFSAGATALMERRRRELAFDVAATMIKDDLPFEVAFRHLDFGVPAEEVTGFADTTHDAVEAAKTLGAELHDALGGSRPAATRAAVRWLADHADIDTTHLVHDAKTYAAQVAAGEAPRRTVARWLAQWSPRGAEEE